MSYLAMAAGAAPEGAVIYLTRPQSGKSDAEVEINLRAVFAKVRASRYEPFVPRECSENLMTALPAGGDIVTADSLARFDAKVYTLSNGIRVVAKRTDYKPDQIFIRGYSPGGISMLYDEKDVPTLRVINELMAVMKHGGLSANDMQRILDGQNVKVSASAIPKRVWKPQRTVQDSKQRFRRYICVLPRSRPTVWPSPTLSTHSAAA